MISLVDHPEDIKARVVLRASLRGGREQRRLSMAAAGRLAGFPSSTTWQAMEGSTNWEVWRVQQAARGIDQVLRLCIENLYVPVDDVRSAILRATTTFGGFDTDQMHLRLVGADLVRARRKLRVSRVELARRCRVDEKLLRRWEEDPTRSLLRTVQRYARGLGGVIRPDLAPIQVEVRS